MPKELTPEEKTWKRISGEMFPKINAIKKVIKEYSYKDYHDSQVTDERICEFFIQSLRKTKRSIFSVSDICFSLHLAEDMLPLTDVMRDEVDILTDEIMIRHSEWTGMMPHILKKIIKHDLDLVKGMQKINKDLDIVFNGILTEVKAHKKARPAFWKKIKNLLLEIRKTVRDMAVLFKERETLCNLHPLTLDRTFKKIQEEIRWTI